jgi:hypothetical protein
MRNCLHVRMRARGKLLILNAAIGLLIARYRLTPADIFPGNNS